jgi:hypothetical protein
MTHQIYYWGMSPFLDQVGFKAQSIMPFMSLGQVSEVLMLGLLGLCLSWISIKNAMVFGLLAQVARYAVFAYGRSVYLLLIGVMLHGFCYAFYFTAAYIYVDQHSTPQTRAGTQQLFTIMIAGFGTLTAYLAGGYLGQLFTVRGGGIDFRLFWLVPTVLSFVVAGAMFIFFREERPIEVEEGMEAVGGPSVI